MKKIIMMAGLFLLGAAAYAADNKITMVTYFPTPYMVYQDVTVTGPCDMGLIRECKLEVIKDLQVNSMSVDEDVTLTLAGHDAQANALKSGQGSASRGSLVFEKNLMVNTLPAQVQALETEEGTIAGLNLGSKAFPTCTATDNKISWKNLTINGQAGVYLVCGEGTGGNSCSDNPNQEKCCNTAAPVCQYWNKSSSKCYTKSCESGVRHLDTSTCQCVCDKTQEDCGYKEGWSVGGLGSDCTCNCGTCVDTYNGREPRAGDLCYAKYHDGNGNFFYRMGVVTGDPTCNNCVRNITCEFAAFEWKQTSGPRYYWKAAADEQVAQSHSSCRSESDLNKQLFREYPTVHNSQSAACKDAVGKPSQGGISSETCWEVYTYTCQRSATSSTPWTQFEYGYPPCYPNC